MSSPSAIVLSQGTELTSGSVLDSNSNWLCQQLWSRGFIVQQIVTLPDDQAAITNCLETLDPVDVVISTGGLGPTPDDLTRQSIAHWLRCPLEHSPTLWLHVNQYLQQRNRPPTEAHGNLALLPRVSDGWTVEAIPNRLGSACGLHLKHQARQWFFLPGVPSEMKQMTMDTVLELLPQDPFQLLQLGTVGLAETQILERVPERWRSTLSIRAHRKGSLIKFRLPEHELGLFPVNELHSNIREHCYSLTLTEHEKHADLAWCVLQELAGAEHTLALAESCTAGGVAAWVASHSGASQVLKQGVVVYSNAAKTQYCDVPTQMLKEHGAVSEPVARQLAAGIRAASSCTWGIGITGVAGPGGGSPKKPVGTVHISVSGPETSIHQHCRFSGGRTQVVESASATALSMLLRAFRENQSTGAASEIDSHTC